MTTELVGEATIVERADIEAARRRIAGHVRSTPVLEAGAGSFGLEMPLVLKLELMQHTGSFKPRGAFNKMLASDVPSAGVVAASGGNFGLAVAYAARELGHRAEIFVPDTSPDAKIDGIRELGADVQVVPGYYHEASVVAARTPGRDRRARDAPVRSAGGRGRRRDGRPGARRAGSRRRHRARGRRAAAG